MTAPISNAVDFVRETTELIIATTLGISIIFYYISKILKLRPLEKEAKDQLVNALITALIVFSLAVLLSFLTYLSNQLAGKPTERPRPRKIAS